MTKALGFTVKLPLQSLCTLYVLQHQYWFLIFSLSGAIYDQVVLFGCLTAQHFSWFYGA